MTTTTVEDAKRLAAILERIEVLTAKFVADGQAQHPILSPDRYETEVGAKFIRIVCVHGGNGQRMVHAFVDVSNGNLIKAAGWKAPAKRKNGLAVCCSLLDDDKFAWLMAEADRFGHYLYVR